MILRVLPDSVLAPSLKGDEPFPADPAQSEPLWQINPFLKGTIPPWQGLNPTELSGVVMDSALYTVVGLVIAANIFLLAVAVMSAIRRKRIED